MEKFTVSALPVRNLAFFLICAGGLLLFLILAIYPNHNALSGMDDEIARLEARLEDQKRLVPVVNKLIRRMNAEKMGDIQLPQRSELKAGETEKAARRIREIAGDAGLGVSEIRPDADAMTEGGSDYILRTTLTGDFMALQAFLSAALGAPYVDAVDDIRIHAAGKHEFMQMNIFIAVEK